MKAYHFALTILISCLVLATACTKKPTNFVLKTDRLVTIRAGGTLGCEVDYPVAVVYKGQHYPRWKSVDNKYWIHFVGGSPFPGVDPIDVPSHGESKQIDITGPAPNYYKYEIWSQYDSSTGQNKKCKDADDDHDTGLNVKE
jgi:hypothetical protein